MRRLAGIAFAIVTVVACGQTAIVVGDDSTTTPNGSPNDPLIDPDAAPFDGSTDDEPPPITVPPPDSGKGDASSDVTCPTLSPPSPSFCDGATPVAKYDSNACVVGYGCAPLDCASAGGQCVAITPSACAAGNFGDATKYSCGGGLGVGCCLP